MSRVAKLLVVMATLAVTLWAAQALLAASTDYVLVAGITEGPDPIPRVIWVPVDRLYPGMQLEPDRSDGRPDVSLDPAGRAVVAWAYRSAAGHEVAVLRWDRTSWGPVRFVTSSPAVELDPRAFVAPGDSLHVVWWVEGPTDRVYYLQPQGGGPGFPQMVASDARRPSVVVAGGEVLLAYERDAAPGRREIVLASRGVLGTFRATPLFEVPYGGALDVVLHYEKGRTWLDWKSGSGVMAYSERVGTSWTAPVTLPWSDPSWAGSEDVRRQIRQIVLPR